MSKEIKIHCLYTELIDPAALMNHPKNRNKHGQDQIERLAELFQYHGIRHPIIVSNRTKCIVAGHGRKLAAIRAGIKKYPVVYQDFKNDEAEYAFIQADNAIALWAEMDMAGINTDLQDLGPDFDINMLGLEGFTLDVSDKFEDKDADELPEEVEPNAKLGQIYQLGQHRLMCGDSKDQSNIDQLTNNENDYLLLTDPPYGMSVVKSDGMVGGERKGSVGWKTGTVVGASKMHKAKVGVYKPIIGDDEFFDPTYLTKLGTDQIIFGANHFSTHLPLSPHWIVWYKDMPVGTDFSGAELAWTSIDKKAVKTYKWAWAGMTRQGSRTDELAKRVHPTQKPVGLYEAILKDYDYKNIVDLFGGSGSCLIACEKTGRKCFMMELDPHYIDVIIARWEKFTGKRAELLNG